MHKWFGAPLGTGLLYVRKDPDPRPLAPSGRRRLPREDIRRLNHIGTNPVHAELTIADALQFHRRIGSARKEARLRFLQRYWTDQVRGTQGITLNTPVEPHRACAIANVGVDRLAPTELAQILMDRHRLWTVAIDVPQANVREHTDYPPGLHHDG